MNAGGYGCVLEYGGEEYYFHSLKISVQTRPEDTSLLNGRLYRVRAGSFSETIQLRSRISHGELPAYRTLIQTLAGGTCTVAVNGVSISGCTLLTGRISSEEGSQFADCELVLTEVTA